MIRSSEETAAAEELNSKAEIYTTRNPPKTRQILNLVFCFTISIKNISQTPSLTFRVKKTF
jgi:hypothetical protein